MVSLVLWLRRWRMGHDQQLLDDADSDISERDIQQIRAWQESRIEQLVQDFARKAYKVRIQVSVFDRLEGKGNGSMLAVVRPADLAQASPAVLDESLVLKIIEEYNCSVRSRLMRPIGCVVWSATSRFAVATPTAATIISNLSARGS